MSIRYNANGQLGTGDNTLRNIVSPIPFKFSIQSSVGIKKIECGSKHTLVITYDNKVYGFGNNEGVCCIFIQFLLK